MKLKLKWLPTSRKAKWLEIIVAVGLIVVVMFWQTGAFAGGKIKPGRTPLPGATTPRRSVPAVSLSNGSARETIVVQSTNLPVIYKAVGTVRSRTQIDLAPRIVARILEIKVRSGDRVAKGDVLVKLDDAELSSGVRQAAERARQARAALDLAATELERTRKLLAGGNLSQQAFDQSDSAARQARAVAEATAEAARQAEAVLGYATLVSPIDGVVAERLSDPGDIASPGNVLLRLFDPTRLLLEVPVREGLVTRIQLGEQVPFRVDALNTNLTGDVREVVPSVDPGSRTFLVKICIGETPALMPGMFGVLQLPTGTRRALTLPENYVQRVGQLEYVRTLLDGQPRQVLVRTVPAADGQVEVVSGLETGMAVLAP
jgi:RND family efflux transporter MFP subunit